MYKTILAIIILFSSFLYGESTLDSKQQIVKSSSSKMLNEQYMVEVGKCKKLEKEELKSILEKDINQKNKLLNLEAWSIKWSSKKSEIDKKFFPKLQTLPPFDFEDTYIMPFAGESYFVFLKVRNRANYSVSAFKGVIRLVNGLNEVTAKEDFKILESTLKFNTYSSTEAIEPYTSFYIVKQVTATELFPEVKFYTSNRQEIQKFITQLTTTGIIENYTARADLKLQVELKKYVKRDVP